jgi:hypothetical protein
MDLVSYFSESQRFPQSAFTVVQEESTRPGNHQAGSRSRFPIDPDLRGEPGDAKPAISRSVSPPLTVRGFL